MKHLYLIIFLLISLQINSQITNYHYETKPFSSEPIRVYDITPQLNDYVVQAVGDGHTKTRRKVANDGRVFIITFHHVSTGSGNNIIVEDDGGLGLASTYHDEGQFNAAIKAALERYNQMVPVGGSWCLLILVSIFTIYKIYKDLTTV